jgi:hypothetical protein
MSALVEILGQSLGGDAMDQIGEQLGVDRQTAQSAVGVALPVLVGALSRNAASPSGHDALEDAIQRHHDGGLLDGLEGYLGRSSDGGIGGSILGHILGGRQDGMAQSVGRASGLDASSAAQLLALLAPIVLAALGRARGQAGGGSLTDILGGAQSHMQQHSPDGMDLVSQMLDSNHDGSVADDVARMGVGLLGSLFSQRR